MQQNRLSDAARSDALDECRQKLPRAIAVGVLIRSIEDVMNTLYILTQFIADGNRSSQ